MTLGRNDKNLGYEIEISKNLAKRFIWFLFQEILEKNVISYNLFEMQYLKITVDSNWKSGNLRQKDTKSRPSKECSIAVLEGNKISEFSKKCSKISKAKNADLGISGTYAPPHTIEGC